MLLICSAYILLQEPKYIGALLLFIQQYLSSTYLDAEALPVDKMVKKKVTMWSLYSSGHNL